MQNEQTDGLRSSKRVRNCPISYAEYDRDDDDDLFREITHVDKNSNREFASEKNCKRISESTHSLESSRKSQRSRISQYLQKTTISTRNQEPHGTLTFLSKPQKATKVSADKFDKTVSTRRSSRNSDSSVNYLEATSDDEFASKYVLLSQDLSSLESKALKLRQKSGSSDGFSSNDDDDIDGDSQSENGSDCDTDESPTEQEYKIHHILGTMALTAIQWQDICGCIETRELTRFSVLMQPDEEYFDNSDEKVVKFLIKWTHASYLHVSWETEKDLLELDPNASNQLKKFRQRESQNSDLFDDLSPGEFFPPQYLCVEKILDIDDETVDIATIDWKTAIFPPIVRTSSTAANGTARTDKEFSSTTSSDLAAGAGGSDIQCTTSTVQSVGEGEILYGDNPQGDDVVQLEESISVPASKQDTSEKESDDVVTENATVRSSRTRGRPSKQKADVPNLHGSDCWVTVKWEGLTYADVSVESVADLRARGIDYEGGLRRFYRREQLVPAKGEKGRVSRVLNKSVLGQEEPPAFAAGALRDYQWEGVRWMLFNWSQRRNSILADEMGLGKTVQTAAFLQMLKEHQNLRGPFLVVAPLSTVVNWQREVTAWTDMDVVLYHGSQEEREIIRRLEFSYATQQQEKGAKKSTRQSDGVKLEVVVVSPETCLAMDSKSSSGRVRRALSKIYWDVIVVDEAHKLKNHESKFTTTLREEYSYRNSLLLTGTPLQNNTEELWTLLNFVDRAAFADRDAFMEEFGALKTAAQLEALHGRLKPYLLRREKDNVEKTVPPKEELIVEVELTVPQKQYYRAIYEMNTSFLYRGEAKDGPRLSNLAMELRKCCNHPFLIKGGPAALASHFEGDSPLEVMIKASGKMKLLDKLLPKLQADGHRVLIFSQFRIMLNIIEDYMSLKGFTYDRVDGAVTGKMRQAAIDRYSTGSVFAMLLSTRAGGVGINLTAADTVIIFDSDWNPQNDLQAQARAHRIGQTRPVKVYRLLTRKTYEMVMFKAASLKLGLDYAVMHNMDASKKGGDCGEREKGAEEDATGENVGTDKERVSASSLSASGSRRGRRGASKPAEVDGISLERAEHASSLSKRELENLLKHGAYDIFREDHDGKAEEESAKFFDDDIDKILQRSAMVVHDSKGNSAMTKSSTSFAKASFVSSISADGTANNIALDDPDFWTKVVGLSAKADESGEVGPRKRKCRAEVTSYKEPGLNMFKLGQGGEEGGDGSDSDSDGSDNEVNQATSDRKKSRKSVDVLVTAEWTETSLQKLLAALVARGFGKWVEIRAESKLKWTLLDISRGCRLLVLQLLFWSTMQVHVPSSSSGGGSTEGGGGDTQDATSITTSTATATGASSTRMDNTIEQVPSCPSIDSASLEVLLRKYKSVRLALAAHLSDPFIPREHVPDLSSLVTVSDVLPSQLTEVQLLARSYSSASAGQGPQDTFSSFLRMFESPSSQVGISATSDLALVEDKGELRPTLPGLSFDACCHTVIQMEHSVSDFSKLPLAAIESCLSSLGLTESFTAVELGRESRVRTSARAKLSQLEDLFDLYLAAGIHEEGQRWEGSPLETRRGWTQAEPSVALVESSLDTSMAVASMLETEADEPYVNAPDKQNCINGATDSEPTSSTAAACLDVSSSSLALQHFLQSRVAARETGCGKIISPDPGLWDRWSDTKLVLAIDKVGWPEGKRRMAMITRVFEELSKDDGPRDHAPSSTGIAVDASQSDDAVDLERADVQPLSHCRERSLIADPKFVSKRARELALLIRGIPAVAAKVAVGESKAEAEKGAAREAAKEAAREVKEGRRLAQTVLRVMSKVGRPRSNYDAIELQWQGKVASASLDSNKSEIPYDAAQHLLSWSEFVVECGRDATDENIQRVQALVEATLAVGAGLAILSSAATASTTASAAARRSGGEETEAGTDVICTDEDGVACTDEAGAAGTIGQKEDSKAAGKVITVGPLAGCSIRQAEAAVERSAVLHRLRIALIHHSTDNFSKLQQIIRRECKCAGPSIPKPRRDMTLPVWWTPLHDVRLLQLVAEDAAPRACSTAAAMEADTSPDCDSDAKPLIPADADDKRADTTSGNKDQRDVVGINWKKVILDTTVSTAASTFTLPYKAQGTEWATELTTKTAEKRFMAVLQASGVVPHGSQLPPGSPDRGDAKLKPVAAAPTAYGGRPSWVASMMAPLSSSSVAASSSSSNSTAALKEKESSRSNSAAESSPVVCDLRGEAPVLTAASPSLSGSISCPITKAHVDTSAHSSSVGIEMAQSCVDERMIITLPESESPGSPLEKILNAETETATKRLVLDGASDQPCATSATVASSGQKSSPSSVAAAAAFEGPDDEPGSAGKQSGTELCMQLVEKEKENDEAANGCSSTSSKRSRNPASKLGPSEATAKSAKKAKSATGAAPPASGARNSGAQSILSFFKKNT